MGKLARRSNVVFPDAQGAATILPLSMISGTSDRTVSVELFTSQLNNSKLFTIAVNSDSIPPEF